MTTEPKYAILTALLVAMLLAGCAGTSKPDSSAPDSACVDADEDGWCANEDCDDLQATTYPGSSVHDYCLDGLDNDCDGQIDETEEVATEDCDGVDNNCNGEIDEGVSSTYYNDLDGDGYGDINTTTLACEATENWVAAPGDCDDGDPYVYPTATEVCDGVDNNCDGAIDEGCATAARIAPRPPRR